LANADSIWDERCDGFSSPSPTHNSTKSNNELESFLSLLPWGKYLLTPEKPKNCPVQSVAQPYFAYPTSKPDILNGHPGLPLSPRLNDDDDYSLYLNEPREFFSPSAILHEDYFFEEQLAMSGLNKRRSSEFKNDPWFPRDFTGEVDHWNHRVLFPPENLDDLSHFSESERN